MANAINSHSETEISEKLQQAYAARVNDLRGSIKITSELLGVCALAGYKHLAGVAQNYLALYYLIQSEYTLAEKYACDALQYFEQCQDKRGMADANYNLGSIYYLINNCHQSLLLLTGSLKTYEELNDLSAQARTLRIIGGVYEYFKDDVRAITSFERSVELSQKIGDKSLESSAMNWIASLYFRQGQHDLAMTTIQQSILYKQESADLRGLAFGRYVKGKLLIKLGRFQEADAELHEVIGVMEKFRDRTGLSLAYNKLGLAAMGMNQLVEARKYFESALDFARRFKIDFLLYRIEYNLYLLCKLEGAEIEALSHIENHVRYRETTNHRELYDLKLTYKAIEGIREDSL